MRVQVLQHVPFEDIGAMAPWMALQGADVRYTRFFEHPTLPDVSGLDLVIAMGGPMSVNDEASLPWLVDEKRFLREAIAKGVPVLGICLGAQLIASALGARVYAARHKEIGWFPVKAVPVPATSFVFPDAFMAFHWHGETFDLPEGAVHLARSAGCDHQAFQVGRRVMGLQFHLEMTPQGASALLDACAGDLVPRGPYTQSAPALRQMDPGIHAGSNLLMQEVLHYIAL